MSASTTRSSAGRQVMVSLKAMLLFTMLLGLVYPALVWGLGQLVARDAANGSLVEVRGEVVGSSLIGQNWHGAEWFHSRPSASDYADDVSGGTNLAPGKDLDAAVAQRRADGGLGTGPGAGVAPADELTASGSGLDPHISPDYAAAQVARVARARGLSTPAVTALVAEHTQGRTLGFLGAARVNVLELNLSLAALPGQSTPPSVSGLSGLSGTG